ncbi:MAG: PQQ-dependent sugar dehydrogenase [Wenzhouxiangellaceae bacterium]|nr:PQQ-dependent sugar dehydrogenase [Wenzhouxiangellaceae bacterium]
MRTSLWTLPILLLMAGCGNGASGPEQADPAAAPMSPEMGADVSAEAPAEDDAAEQTARIAIESQEPEESRPPNAEWQEPAFPGQTRAPKPAYTEAWSVETVAEGLDHPWALEFLPDGSLLVTERSGSLRHVLPDGTISEPLAGVPGVHNVAQGGLLDVALAPDFPDSRRIFLTFSEPTGDASRTSVATATLSEDHTALTGTEVIFRQEPEWQSRGHYGSRIVFATDGTMYVTFGDRMDRTRTQAQDPLNHIGTVIRILPDGTVPEDNPFVEDPSGAAEVWSWGHRNIQAADLHPETGELWTIEHGPQGGDELNRPEAGRNYGWPKVTYGENYDGTRVTEGVTRSDDTVQPVYYWDPVIAPSGMDFYTGDLFETWRGNLFVGGLGSGKIVRLVMDGDRVLAEEWLEIGRRVRDVKEAPDGTLWLVTDHDNGQVMRIVAGEPEA